MLLMLAPISERPKINELQELMTRLEDYFVMHGEAEEFSSQLLERKRNEDLVPQDSNNKPIFSR